MISGDLRPVIPVSVKVRYNINARRAYCFLDLNMKVEVTPLDNINNSPVYLEQFVKRSELKVCFKL